MNNLSNHTKKLLVMQGFSVQDVYCNPNILPLSKWTPFACGIMGLIGVITGSPFYFFALGVLAFIGAIRPHSFFDYLYRYIFRPIFDFGEMVPHGIQRKIGCGIGGVMFIISGLGFYYGIMPLAYIPACFMATFAIIAGIFNWCFVSTFYALATRSNTK